MSLKFGKNREVTTGYAKIPLYYTIRPYIDISSKVYQDNICSDTEAIALLNSTISNKILESI